MTNPFLTAFDTPNYAPPFDKIKVEHYMPAVEAGIIAARKNIDLIADNAATPTYDNTIVAMEDASEILDQVTAVFYCQLNTEGGDDMQVLAEQIGPVTAQFSTDVILNEKLFARVKDLYERKDRLGLSVEQSTILDDTYQSFVRGGALLNESKKARLREINERMSLLGPTFANNVKKATEEFELIIDNSDDLAGLPQGIIDAAAEAAAEKDYTGKWLFTLDYPSFGPFMQYADKRELREKISKAYGARAWKDAYDNCPVLLETAILRQERAELLGFESHADYVLARRMAASPQGVYSFLDRLKAVYKPMAEKDLEALKAFASTIGGPSGDDFKAWDVSYYSEKLRQKLFDFSGEDFRPYFPLEATLDGTFEHFSRLFGIKFIEAGGKYPAWHKDVKVYDVIDSATDRFMGTLYADFFPRSGKKPGAWQMGYRAQGLYRGKVERPVLAIVCNFTKPTKEKPSLLTHDEVATLFHEMGHAVHNLLSDVTYQAKAGTSVKWDFVELPSQLQENWTYEKETLDRFARHYETGEPIPASLLQKLKAAKNYMVAWVGLRQVALGLTDMGWHTAPKIDETTDVAAFEDKLVKDVTFFERSSGPVSTSFAHIFAGGYSAGYYSYKWAEVLEADTFEAFMENGLYDPKTAMAYRTEVLAKGGTEPPEILYKNFRGRDADPDALLRREGLLGD